MNSNNTLSDFNIGFEGSDETVSSLIMRYDEGDLVIDIDYQRGDVWDVKRSSKLIESVCLGLPLPIFYTFETGEQSELIDGKQRFLSLLKYINGEYKLTALKELRHLKGKKFGDLSREIQRTIKNHKLHVFSISADTEEAKYEIFERLNTGGTILKSQEIILGLNEGKVTDFAKRVAEKLIELGIEKPNANRHKQVDARVLLLMFFSEESPSHKIASSRNRVLHEVLTNPKYLNKLNDDYLNATVELMRTAKESAINVGNLITEDCSRVKLNQSMFEVFICVFSKYAKDIPQLQPNLWRELTKPLENFFAREILQSKETLLAFTYSTNNKTAREIKSNIIDKLRQFDIVF